MSARLPVLQALQASAQGQCSGTARLSSDIAMEASTVMELLSGLLDRGNEAACALQAVRLQVARIGLLADVLAQAHGGTPTRGDRFEDWLLEGQTTVDAYRALATRNAPAGDAP